MGDEGHCSQKINHDKKLATVIEIIIYYGPFESFLLFKMYF
ncbi:hypothetical protein M2408_000025 [Sphingobacterium sp. BIGb0165]|nr:hypothetical protein [Sphingobacterium sp. BIGb0165]